MIWSSVLVALLAGVSLVRCSSEDSFQRDEPANSAKFNQLQTNKLVERSSEENNEQIIFENEEFIQYEQDMCDLSGLWYNQHGSELFLNQSVDGKLTGEYRTNVELKEGSAGDTYSLVSGSVSAKLFSFHVVWRGGNTMTTWIGQCHRKCNVGFYRTKDPILHTTWVMVNQIDTCENSWSANRIGQDSFVRRPLKNGPRKALGKNTPVRKT